LSAPPLTFASPSSPETLPLGLETTLLGGGAPLVIGTSSFGLGSLRSQGIMTAMPCGLIGRLRFVIDQ
jgi:hypothetical protein